MSVQFGNCSDPTNKINRSYSLGTAHTFAPYSSVDVINPVIIVSAGAVSSTNNVMYISDYSRYYHITGIQYDGKRAIVSGSVDVAKTYASSFYSTQYVTRNATEYDLTVPDNLLPVSVTEIPKVTRFGIANLKTTESYVIGLTACQRVNEAPNITTSQTEQTTTP